MFLLAAVISVVTHYYAHFIAHYIFSDHSAAYVFTAGTINLHGIASITPIMAAAGPIWTFGLALASFGLYLHNPRNLFAASMAFINACYRLPETITVFLQLLIQGKTTLLVDESFSLSLIKLNDPTVSIVFLCFFSLTILFLTITIVHDTKMIPWKWLVAVVLFIALIPLDNLISRTILQLAV